VESLSGAEDHEGVTTPAASARAPAHRRFRLAVVVTSVVAAVVGSVLLATRDSREKATTRGITATLRLPGHPGSVAAGADLLWVALNGDPRRPVADRPLLRLNLATGTVVQSVHVGGEVSYLARDGVRLIASVKPVGGGEGFGPRRLVALDWRSGVLLPLGESHLSDTDAQEIDGPVDQVVRAGDSLWALEVRPGRLLQLDRSTLAPSSAPIRISSGRALGLAAGDGDVWVTAADAGEVLRIDPTTGAIRRAHVGGFPVGIAVTSGGVWFADRSDGNVVRLDPRTLRPIGDPIHVGTKPSSLVVAGDSLFVTDEDAGTIERIDVHSGQGAGAPIRFAPPTKDSVAPALSSSGKSLWVSSFASNTVTRITPASLAAPSNEVTLEGTGNGPVNPGPYGTGVTNGSVAGTGHFTLTGAIDDKGTYIGYRSVRDQIATVRDVLTSKKGTITIVITIHLGRESPAPWTITSGTKSYVGLHGEGRLIVDNYESDPYTFVMKGTVSR
jgi:hypothetical protein